MTNVERVRAKMYLEQIEELPSGVKRVKFRTMYDPELPEDQRFCTATPDGTCDMLITNPAALEMFERNRNAGQFNYYVDFVPVPKPPQPESS